MTILEHGTRSKAQRIKGYGGVLGLTEDEEKLQCWMVCGPEVARAIAKSRS